MTALFVRSRASHRPTHIIRSTYLASSGHIAYRTVCGVPSLSARVELDTHPEKLCDRCALVHNDWIVYRLFDSSEALLYLGHTGDIDRRITQHRLKPWWFEVRDYRLEHYPTQADAWNAEHRAILAERPRYNRTRYVPPALRREALRRWYGGDTENAAA